MSSEQGLRAVINEAVGRGHPEQGYSRDLHAADLNVLGERDSLHPVPEAREWAGACGDPS
jgi:hypothetical protein